MNFTEWGDRKWAWLEANAAYPDPIPGDATLGIAPWQLWKVAPRGTPALLVAKGVKPDVPGAIFAEVHPGHRDPRKLLAFRAGLAISGRRVHVQGLAWMCGSDIAQRQAIGRAGNA